jgi:hypothetical protein
MIVDTAKKVIETYKNLYIPKKQTEKFDDDSCNDESYVYSLITAIISWLVTGFAIYLSFKCSNGFNICQFLLALFCSPFYIIYHIFSTKLCGLM